MAKKTIADSIRWWIEAMSRDVPIAGSFERAMDIYIPFMEKEIRLRLWRELETLGGDWDAKAKCLLQI